MIGVFIRMKAAPLVLLQRSMMLNDHVLANLFNDEGSQYVFPNSATVHSIFHYSCGGIPTSSWTSAALLGNPKSTKIPANHSHPKVLGRIM